uniref:Uncharacterized protein n=1 Tax=Arundo donax TaxID=35708 RepID=A0A0A8YF76_ARUDO
MDTKISYLPLFFNKVYLLPGQMKNPSISTTEMPHSSFIFVPDNVNALRLINNLVALDHEHMQTNITLAKRSLTA